MFELHLFPELPELSKALQYFVMAMLEQANGPSLPQDHIMPGTIVSPSNNNLNNKFIQIFIQFNRIFKVTVKVR